MENQVIREQLLYVKNLAETYPDIRESIGNYTSSAGFFREINTGLRRRVKIEENDASLVRKNLDIAFQGAPPLEKPLTVYRGKSSDRMRPRDEGFVSTSLLRSRALNFAGPECCVLEITVPPGSKVLPVAFISFASDELEIILNRGGKFIVSGTKIDREKGMKIIYVSYIPMKSQESRSLEEIVDPGKLNQTQLQESVISYLTGMDILPEEIDNEILRLSKKENFELTPETITAIKMRLGFVLTKTSV